MEVSLPSFLRPFAVALALASTVPAIATAQTPPSETPAESMEQATTSEQDMGDVQARGHFRLGREYYEQGRFADAAQEFEIAFGLSGRGQLLYNVYLAYRDAQDLPNAARALRGYLASVPDAPDREHLSARLAQLEQSVTQDQEDEARRVAEAAEAARQLEEAERRAMEAEMLAAQGPSRPAWPWAVLGGGLALVVVGVIIDVVAATDADRLRHDCVVSSPTMGFEQPLLPGTSCSPAVQLESRRSAIQSEALAGDILWVSGAVVAATGLILAFALPDEYPAGTPPPVAAGCSPTGCSATITASF
jgi:tetratricopeptide (TPR) repeat protein